MYRIKIYAEESNLQLGGFLRIKEIRLFGLLIFKKEIIDNNKISLSPNVQL